MTRTQFVVSDLHMGDGGPRDNFAYMSGGWREQEFNNFLDYVEGENGELTLLGDTFELWQSNISKVLTCRMKLLDRLADMNARLLIGNHDIDLLYFTDKDGMLLNHPLFSNLQLSHTLNTNGRKILLIHGHEQDVYCRSEVPGIGRASAIYAGLREDRNGSPLSKWKFGAHTVEARSLNRFDRWSRLARRCLGKPSACQVMRRAIKEAWVASGADALIYGHTHEPGQFVRDGNKLPIYNTGTWAEQVNTFARIDESGRITLCNWERDRAYHNSLELNVL